MPLRTNVEINIIDLSETQRLRVRAGDAWHPAPSAAPLSLSLSLSLSHGETVPPAGPADRPGTGELSLPPERPAVPPRLSL